MSFLKKCDVVLEKAIAIFCTILFAGILLDILAGVFWRYVLNNPLTWYEEVARFLSIWMILVGSSMTIRIDGHTSIDFVQMIIKNPKGRTIAYVITRVIAAISMILGTAPAAAAGFITTDVITYIFTVTIVWIASRLDGILEDQKHYLQRINDPKNREGGIA